MFTNFENMVSPSQSKVYFFFDTVKATLDNRKELKHFIEQIFRKERKKLLSLNYVFCSDKKLLQVNRDYLRHDYYTDIITFDLSSAPGSIIGEIYISVDRVRDNAGQFGVSFRSELHRVIFHGALHLCGYADKNKTQVQEMRRLEDKYLHLYQAFHMKH
jgi:rRNA maturation RNase YbeY